jgi:hypothetical protein
MKHRDRAAAATTAVLQIVRDQLPDWLRGDDVAPARAAVEAYLRDEFYNVARTVASEVWLGDEPEDPEANN